MDWLIRPALSTDMAAVEELLRASALPLDGVFQCYSDAAARCRCGRQRPSTVTPSFGPRFSRVAHRRVHPVRVQLLSVRAV
jgi:hypothetical protein